MIIHKFILSTLSSTIALLILALIIFHTLEGFEYTVSMGYRAPSPPNKYVYVSTGFSIPYRVLIVEVEDRELVKLTRIYVNDRLYVNPEGVIDCGGPCIGFIQVVSDRGLPVPYVTLRAYTGHLIPVLLILALSTLLLSILAWVVVRRGGGLYSLG